MKILFLTIGAVYNFDNNGAYTDLLKRFQEAGHNVYVVGATEKRAGLNTKNTIEHGINVLRVKIGNITKTNFIEKGISTITISRKYKKEISRYWNNVVFDLILYTTPPITIASLVNNLKKRYNAYTYLLLKDIFPQNAVDIGILKKTGWKGFVFWYFRHIEKSLYRVSDKIGCMSQANVDFVLANNKMINLERVEICPNTIDMIPSQDIVASNEILSKYNLPSNKYLLLYGGNFGKPQNVDYIINSIRLCSKMTNIHFVLCGSGTDYYKVDRYIETEAPNYVSAIKQLPYDEYSKLVASCHVGLLFLDYRFTIPNFPSRLLDYMNYGLPVIAATDINTDIRDTIEDGEFGWWVESKEPHAFFKLVNQIFNDDHVKFNLDVKSYKAREKLRNEFRTDRAYMTILKTYNTDK